MVTPTLDLRAPEQGAGFGIFAEGASLFFGQWVQGPDGWNAPQDTGGLTNLGDDPGAIMSMANRNALADGLRLGRASLPNSTLSDILAHFIMGTLADPRGQARVKPLRFGRRGLELYLNNTLVLQEPLDTNHPNFQATLDVRWADYQWHKAAGTPLEILQRWTGADALKLFGREPTSADLDRLIPTEHRQDGSRRPTTQVTDDFSGTLAAWTILVGSWAINTGVLEASRASASNEDGHIRNDTDLSSDDHTVTVSNLVDLGGGSNEGGVDVRCNSANSERYHGQLERVVTNSHRLRLRRFSTANSPTTLLDGTAFTLNDGYNVEIILDVTGGTLTLSLTTPAESINTTDANITGNLRHGIAGRLFSSIRNSWDNYLADDGISPAIDASGNLAGAGQIAGSGTKVFDGLGGLLGAGALTGSGEILTGIEASGNLAGAATLSASSDTLIEGNGQFLGAGQIIANGGVFVDGSGQLIGSGTLIAAIFNGPQIHLKGQYEPEINLAGSV